MDNQEFVELCKRKVESYILKTDDTPEGEPVKQPQIYVVWLSKALQNNKALLSTDISDGMYYECTYNGDKHELYLDAYKKWENVCIKV